MPFGVQDDGERAIARDRVTQAKEVISEAVEVDDDGQLPIWSNSPIKIYFTKEMVDQFKSEDKPV